MHLLRTTAGALHDGEALFDLQQAPAEVLLLSHADTDLALLAHSYAQRQPPAFSLRLANLGYLRHHAALDLYLDNTASAARVIIVLLLGGIAYWPYGVERLAELARQRGIALALLPGDDQWDTELAAQGTLTLEDAQRLWCYLRHGGRRNAESLLDFIGQRWFKQTRPWLEPCPLPRVTIYHPQQRDAQLSDWQAQWQAEQPVVALLFYRAHLQSGNLAAFDQLLETLQAQGLNPLPLAVASLKAPDCLALIEELLERSQCALILNSTGFAMSAVDAPQARPFQRDVPVLQLLLAASTEHEWRSTLRGLGPRDLAMQVALPEVDGRIITRVVSCKSALYRCELTQTEIVGYQALPERMRWVAELAQRWIALQRKPAADKRIALVLANYPTRDGRLGNGVGLDTPAGTVQILRALHAQGYAVAQLPSDGSALMHTLLGQVTNDRYANDLRPCAASVALEDYLAWFSTLPSANQQALWQRWGGPEHDPMYRAGRLMVAGAFFGHTFVGIQPARGYQLDPSAVYHDPDLVPPHSYLAFYYWLREHYRADAVVHVGKHGNLEWLPGKSLALSAECWPELALGPMPHIYPFIVNDPGEGAQAKRRAQAVIIDHLMPPLTRAESYGPLRELECLADEYYEALSLDPKRAQLLRQQLLSLMKHTHIERELGTSTDEEQLLTRLDAYLCDLKEAQIRDGLHIFGQSPQGELRASTLLALVRTPRGNGQAGQASLLRALANDLALSEDYDPLSADPALPWHGARPACLQSLSADVWRTQGDTRERLELLALRCVQMPELAHAWPATQAVLQQVAQQLAPALDACGAAELHGVLQALQGRFVPPGPSGAPSRGRPEVLPTGRNFYSVDVRAVPTPTAWRVGFASASALLERHWQEQGEYPRTLGLSVWGTATMRTGGDDIAQALALLGVRPGWEGSRVSNFEILPVSVLGRPRVDVLLRVSGFFRDAFSNVMTLFDQAVQAVAALEDESEYDNPLRARILAEQASLQAQGVAEQQARRQAGWRIFGSKPGAYGAGLQGPIDERNWSQRADLAYAYLHWGGYAYGSQDAGTAALSSFSQRVSQLQVVLHNQDNREHDLLDSDDYYQFEGGLIAAAETLSQAPVTAYHADHAQPDQPRIRTLKEEINRVLRSRVVNPKWIAGVKRHGYKGAFELAASVDYLFAFDATAQVVDDYQYALVSEAYLLDADTREFIQQHNPHALREISERLLEAMQRGLWQQPGEYQQRITQLLLESEEGLEDGT